MIFNRFDTHPWTLLAGIAGKIQTKTSANLYKPGADLEQLHKWKEPGIQGKMLQAKNKYVSCQPGILEEADPVLLLSAVLTSKQVRERA